MKSTKEEYLKIYENRNCKALIPFLKKLSEEEKKELIPVLEEIVQRAHINHLFLPTSLVCCDKELFTRYEQKTSYRLDNSIFLQILEFYCPDWFNDFIQDRGANSIDYIPLLKWIIKGFITPNETLLEQSISGYWKFRSPEQYKKLIKPAQVFNSNNELNRIYLLKNALLTNYQELYLYLAPKTEETKQIQTELFQCLESKDTVLVGQILKDLVKIADDKNFQIDNFLQHASILTNSKLKKILKPTLDILGKVIVTRSSKREVICEELLPFFLMKDEEIQQKAASLICQYADRTDETFKENLNQYKATLLQSVQRQLEEFLQIEENPFDEYFVFTQPQKRTSEEQKIVPVQTKEDFLFYLSGFPDNESVYIFDLLPVLLKQFDKEITEEIVTQLKTLYYDVYSDITDYCIYFYSKGEHRFAEGSGLFKHIYYRFLIEYGQEIRKRFPEELAVLQHYDKQVKEFDKKHRAEKFGYESKLTPIEEWFGKKYTSYQPLHRFLLCVRENFQDARNIPLLSTPTHQPAWIDPAVLIKRIKKYQEANKNPDLADLELALSRCAIEDQEQFLIQAEKELTDKNLDSLKVWFNQTLPALHTYTQKINWSISKDKERAPDWVDRYKLEITLPESPFENTNSLFSGISCDKRISLSIGKSDLPYYIWYYPNTPEPVYARIQKEYFGFSQIHPAETRDFLLSSLQNLWELKCELKEFTTLFLASSLLSSEKIMREYAVGLWIEKTNCQQIDNELFGRIIGRLIHSEWTPTKRLTDIILNSFLNINRLHNQETEKLLVAALSNINRPVTNLKKLLETYQEVIALNKSKADTNKIPQLLTWENEKNLKSVIKNLLK